MAAALHDGGGRNNGQLGLLLQLGDGQSAAVAHGALHLVQGGLHAVCQRTGVRHIAVHALLKAQFGGAAQIIALPVAGTVGAFAPVLLHILAVDAHLVRGALVKAGKVAAQHDEVRTHSQSQGDVVIVDSYTSYGKPLVKRVIAKGGDTISIDYSTGAVTVNGELLQEDYIAEPTYLGYDVEFPYTVPEGTVFVMGDNRNRSADSRYASIGQIEESQVIGKVLCILFPGCGESSSRDFGRIGALDNG